VLRFSRVSHEAHEAKYRSREAGNDTASEARKHEIHYAKIRTIVVSPPARAFDSPKGTEERGSCGRGCTRQIHDYWKAKHLSSTWNASSPHKGSTGSADRVEVFPGPPRLQLSEKQAIAATKNTRSLAPTSPHAATTGQFVARHVAIGVANGAKRQRSSVPTSQKRGRRDGPSPGRWRTAIASASCVSQSCL
jgi:hypothetical protein